MTKKFISPIFLLFLLSGCAGISLSEEVDELKSSTKTFGGSIRALDAQAHQALDIDQRTTAEQALVRNSRVVFETACYQRALDAQLGFDTAEVVLPYNPKLVDEAYRQIHFVPLCDLSGVDDVLRPEAMGSLSPLPPSKGSIHGSAVTGSPTLTGSAKALDDYVDALADLASNKSGAAKDEARNRVFESGGALLSALGIPLAGPVAGVLGQIVATIDQAERNRRISEYLTAYNRAMPHLMERMGHAARKANFQLLTNRTQAATRAANTANRVLNRPPLLPRRAGDPPPERILVYRDYADTIAAENAAIVGLRRADPMAAARGFAVAHDALTVAYTSKKAGLASLMAGLKAFKAAADQLETAIEEAEGDDG